MQKQDKQGAFHSLPTGRPLDMNKKSSLIARARSAPTKKKKPRGFLDLAGEIRNQIYGYYFQQGFKCEFAGEKAQLGRKQRKVVKFYKGRFMPREGYNLREVESAPVATVRFFRVLGRYQRIEGLDTRWNTSLTGLIFVCRQVHTESIAFLYENTAFAFDSPSRIVNFLKIPSPLYLAKVTRIQLHYHTYGNPKEHEDVKWKQKHLDSWSHTCKTAAKQLVNLQHIDIWVYISETNVRLNVHEPYLEPIFWFRKRHDPTKTIAKALTTANVRIDTIWNKPDAFVDEGLGWASNHLHCLFGEAVSSVILGSTVDAALVDFNAAWDNRYARYHHHLQFARTGW